MINYNVDPYYDDFDPTKNYHRILFKPGYAVQARELTQSQTILQNQISQFASSVYAQNVPISGGQVTTNLKCQYIKLNTTYNGASIDVTSFNGITITDSANTKNIIAQVIAVAPATGTTVNPGDPPTLIVTYLTGQQFSDGMTIYKVAGTSVTAIATTIGTSGGTTSIGNSSIASISSGVFYVVNGYNNVVGANGQTNKYSIGNFVNVNPQTVILDKYDNTPSLRLGLNITEKTVNYSSDLTLLDPATGSTNYQAPGADRYQINLTLETRPLLLGNDDTFIGLVKYNNGQTQIQTNQTVASTIDDYFAKRTSDTNGDFIVSDFNLTPTTNTINSSTFDRRVGKGVAYVKGYRLENSSDLIVNVPRARTTVTANNNTLYMDYGSYFYVDTVQGLFDTTSGQAIDLHLVPLANVVTTNTTTYNATLYGRARIRGLTYDHNSTDANTLSYVYRAYVYDVVANTLTSNASAATYNTITFYDTTGKFSNVSNTYVGSTLLITSGTATGYIGTVIAYNGATKTATVANTFSNTSGIIPTTTSQFSLALPVSGVQTIANANSTFAISSSANINPSGKIGGIASGATIFENPNQPELIFPLGNPFVSSVSGGSYSSTQIFRNVTFGGSAGAVSLQLNLPTINPAYSGIVTFEGGNAGQALTVDAVKRNFTVIVTATGDTANNGTVGSIMDFCSSGNTVTISSDSSTVTFNSNKYTIASGLTVTVISQVNILNADSPAVLKTKTLISGNTSRIDITGPDSSGASLTDGYTYVSTANGQVYIQNAGLKTSTGLSQSLYVADVKNIVKIIDTGAPGVTPTLSMLSNPGNDISGNYSFNNGQKDTHYGHAFLTLNPGAPVPKGNILVIFNYYKTTSGGDGYYSYMSYSNEAYAQIPTFTSSHGKTYNLRDCIDFRPRRKDGTAQVVYQYSSGDPTTTYYAGYYIPQSATNWNSTYAYYLGRKDKLVLSKDKNFQLIQGTPALSPILPTEPNGSLLIATLSLDPYTAYLPNEAPVGSLPNMSLQRVSHRRWTMSDISDLQTQVNNIEYYTSLNTLEQGTAALQVTDINGLNRFKNGILVDDFSNFGTADTANPNFNASIDTATKRMSAAQSVTNYPLVSTIVYETLGSPANTAAQIGYSINSMGKATTNYFSLPYTPTVLINQPLASNTVNLNPFTTPLYQGVCQLNPPMDNWVDNTQAPSLLLVDPNLQVYQQSNTLNVLNVTNWQTIPGTQFNVNAGTTYTIGHNINPSPYGYVGYSTTTTNTYASQQSQTTLGYWSNLGSSYTQNNGYITNVSIQPYIRSQQLIVRASNMQINTPLQTFFDGVSVDKYITNPDIVELTNVQGTFNQDDILGYYDTSKGQFWPVAVVIGSYVYPNTNGSQVRLYITSNFHTSHKLYDIGENAGTNTVSNAVFDNNGVYKSNTAFGTAASAKLVTFNNQGYVSSVGGGFTTATGNTAVCYAKVISGYDEFMNNFAVWNTADTTSYTETQTFDVSYTVNFPTTGTYYLQAEFDEGGSVYLDGTQIVNGGSNNEGVPYLPSITVTAGNHILRVTAYQYSASDAQVAVAISTAPWAAGGSAATSGNIVFSTINPPLVTPTGVSQVYGMPGGGAYYTGVTQIALNPSASSVTGYYIGSTINITTSYVGQAVAGAAPKVQTLTYTATITAYDGPSRIATLSTPVAVSLGLNLAVGSLVTSTYSLTGTYYNYASAINKGSAQGGGAGLCSNEHGDWVGIFNIPQNTFQTGSRVFRVDNRTTPADPTSATTWAEATFTASGLSTTSQAIDFAPSIVGATNTFTRTQYQDNVLINTSKVLNPWDPVAQTFIIDKTNYPYGAFLTDIKVFFQSKANNSGSSVTLSIVNTLNGYPNGQTLDNSIVTVRPDQVNVSSTPHYLDANTYTTFTFNAPVYVQPGVLYAFILHSQSTEYNIYTAAQNATALPSSVKNLPTDPTPTSITKIGTAPYVCALFESQNSITWTGDQTKAMMFVADAAYFDITKNPKVSFTIPYGLPTRKLTTQDIQKYYSPRLVSNLNGASSITDVVSHAFNLSTTDFIPSGGNINYTYQSLINSSKAFEAEKPVTPGRYGSPTYQNIYLDDNNGPRVLQANNTATFSMFATMSSNNAYVSPFVSDDGLSLYNVQYNINNLGISNNVITLVSGGTGYTQGNTTVTISAPDLSGTRAQAVANVVNGSVQNIVITNQGSGYLNVATITISDTTSKVGTGYVATSNTSNVVTGIGTAFNTQMNAGTQLVTTGNLVIGTISSITNANSILLSANANYALTNVAVLASNTNIAATATGASAVLVSEFSPNGGNAFTKYITKKVTLTNNNVSKDLRVFINAYRPQNTNMYVFYRVQSSSDNQIFENGSWQLMTYVNSSGLSYSSNHTDYKDYELAPGTGGTANGSIQYTSTNGTIYKDFIQFAIKIVLTTSDPTFAPYVNSLQVLALPSNTGI